MKTSAPDLMHVMSFLALELIFESDAQGGRQVA